MKKVYWEYVMKNNLLLIILCIGTMRVRGDSLGPLVGSRLCRMQLPGVRVYGTKEAPVHAGNLSGTLEEISREHPGTPVLAVDAAIGKWNMLGQIAFDAGPLYPGAGMGKDLPAVGDAHITGILGISGPFSFFSLKLAPERLVQKLAQEICDSVAELITKLYILLNTTKQRRYFL